MGQKLCCLRPSTTEDDQNLQQHNNAPPKAALSSIRNPKLEKKSVSNSKMMTLQDCLMDSPSVLNIGNGAGSTDQNTNQAAVILKQPSKRVYPASSSPSSNSSPFYYTPRMSFEFSSGKMDKNIDHHKEKLQMSVAGSISRSGSGKLKKKVTFKVPEEADIIMFYSPRETFE